jgi:hypothetical protein
VNDRERKFWISVRAALLAIVAAIERYAEIGKCDKPLLTSQSDQAEFVK